MTVLIVRGKAKSPVEFEVKLDLSTDEDGMERIETVSFDPYNEEFMLIVVVENYKDRTGHYPKSVLANQIYRNRKNIKYCKDNTDRIEVERSFSLSKRCYGLGLIKCKLEETTYSNIEMSIFVTKPVQSYEQAW